MWRCGRETICMLCIKGQYQKHINPPGGLGFYFKMFVNTNNKIWKTAIVKGRGITYKWEGSTGMT